MLNLIRKRNNLQYVALTASLWFLSACGGQAFQTQAPKSVANNVVTQPNTAVQTAAEEDTSGDTSLPDYNFDFAMRGSYQGGSGGVSCTNPYPSDSVQGTYTSGAIDTDNRLSVTVQSRPYGRAVCAGYTIAYSCLEFTVEVLNSSGVSLGSQTARVGYTANGSAPTQGACAGIANSKTLNFDSRLTAGHGKLRIRVSRPTYDTCPYIVSGSNGTWYVPSGCGMREVLDAHNVWSALAIGVNGTQ